MTWQWQDWAFYEGYNHVDGWKQHIKITGQLDIKILCNTQTAKLLWHFKIINSARIKLHHLSYFMFIHHMEKKETFGWVSGLEEQSWRGEGLQSGCWMTDREVWWNEGAMDAMIKFHCSTFRIINLVKYKFSSFL